MPEKGQPEQNLGRRRTGPQPPGQHGGAVHDLIRIGGTRVQRRILHGASGKSGVPLVRHQIDVRQLGADGGHIVRAADQRRVCADGGRQVPGPGQLTSDIAQQSGKVVAVSGRRADTLGGILPDDIDAVQLMAGAKGSQRAGEDFALNGIACDGGEDGTAGQPAADAGENLESGLPLAKGDQLPEGCVIGEWGELTARQRQDEGVDDVRALVGGDLGDGKATVGGQVACGALQVTENDGGCVWTALVEYASDSGISSILIKYATGLKINFSIKQVSLSLKKQ